MKTIFSLILTTSKDVWIEEWSYTRVMTVNLLTYNMSYIHIQIIEEKSNFCIRLLLLLQFRLHLDLNIK